MATAPPSTDVATTAVETTTEPTTTTTAAPTTTIDPAEALAEEVERDYREGWRRLRLAQQDPTDRVRTKRALNYFSGTSREAVASSLDGFRERRLRILSTPSQDPTVTIEFGPELGSDGEATLRACVLDPWVLVETAGAPDGGDAIVDDGVYAYRNDVVLRRIDGVWTTAQSVQLGEWAGQSSCFAE